MEDHQEIKTDDRKISNILLISNAILVMIALGMIFLIYDRIHSTRDPLSVKNEIPKNLEPFPSVTVLAKAAYVYDLKTREVLFSKNEHTQLPLASLTKLMMAVTAEDLIPKNSHITIRKEFLDTEGDNGLFANESWTLKNLLDFSLTVSSNDGARSIASVVGAMSINSTDFTLGRKEFITQMNIRAKKMGLAQTYFVNESGLDESPTQSGGYGSAEDVARLLEYIVSEKPDLLEATRLEKDKISSLSANHTATNTNEIVTDIPGLIGSKTGFTDLAGGNLSIVFDAGLGHPIAIVVLGSTQNGRFTDMTNLVKATQSYVGQ